MNTELRAGPLEVSGNADLKRGLKKHHVQLVALGGIIGSAYFLGTGYVISSVGPSAILAFLFGGFVIYLTMLCLGELAVAMPITGSFINYATEFISPSFAAGVGWAYWLCIVAYVPSECVAAGIIANFYVPSVPSFYWALAFGALITIINVGQVSNLGRVESILASIKILAIVGFSIAAILIFFGVIGNTHEFVGSRYILHHGGFFPAGGWALLLTMVMILVNYGGVEIVGMTAGEAEDAASAMSVAVKSVTYRIVCIYVIPMFLVTLIFPWDKAGVDQSIFAEILNSYGLGWAGGLFSVIVLIAAFSCANCNLYANIRALYALSKEGMAPKLFSKVNRKGAPVNAAILTLVLCWLIIAAYSFDQSGWFYTYLLGIAGFTGSLCWVSICLSQLSFRKRLLKAGYSKGDLKFVTPFHPWTGILGAGLLTACLLVMAFNADLRPAFYLGLPAFVVPMLLYKLVKRDKTAEKKGILEFEKFFPVKGESD